MSGLHDALVEGYSAHWRRVPAGPKALRHSLLRLPSSDLRELASEVFAANAKQDAEWLLAIAYAGWLQGDGADVTLARLRAVAGSAGFAAFTEPDLAAFLASAGSAITDAEYAAIQNHGALGSAARAAVASDRAVNRSDDSSARTRALTAALGFGSATELSIDDSTGGLSALSATASFGFLRRRPTGVSVVIGAGNGSALTARSLDGAPAQLITQLPDETLAAVVARATGDILIFAEAGTWISPVLVDDLAGALRKNARAVVALPYGARVDEQLRFAPANALSRFDDHASLAIRRSALESVGPLLELGPRGDTAESLREFAARATHLLGDRAVARPATRTGVLHPAGALDLTDRVLPVQHWRAQLRATLDPWTGALTAAPTAAVLEGIPLPFALRDSPDRDFDVIFVGSIARAGWKGGSQVSLLQEVQALAGNGLKVGIVHVEAPRIGGSGTGLLSRPFQRAIDDGLVTRLGLDDEATARLITIRYPPVLQFAPDACAGTDGASRISADAVIIEANQGPAESDGSDRRYVLDDCNRTVRRLFGRDAVWFPQGPLVRAQLEAEHLPGELLGEHDLPGLLDPSDWATPRTPLSGRRPVVGRYSRDHAHKWPDTFADVLRVYGSPEVDFVSMGGHRAIDELRGSTPIPSTWQLLDYDAVDSREFLGRLDFFVYFHHSTYVEAFGRAIAEAMASGAVVILPLSFAAVFGDGAVYREPDEVTETIRSLAADDDAYRAQSQRGADYASTHFGYGRYAGIVRELAGLPATTAGAGERGWPGE